MKATITFRRIVEATIEVEIPAIGTQSETTLWANTGMHGASMLDRIIADKAPNVQVSEGTWEAVEANPSFAAEQKKR